MNEQEINLGWVKYAPIKLPGNEYEFIIYATHFNNPILYYAETLEHAYEIVAFLYATMAATPSDQDGGPFDSAPSAIIRKGDVVEMNGPGGYPHAHLMHAVEYWQRKNGMEHQNWWMLPEDKWQDLYSHED